MRFLFPGDTHDDTGHDDTGHDKPRHILADAALTRRDAIIRRGDFGAP